MARPRPETSQKQKKKRRPKRLGNWCLNGLKVKKVATGVLLLDMRFRVINYTYRFAKQCLGKFMALRAACLLRHRCGAPFVDEARVSKSEALSFRASDFEFRV